MLNGSAGHDATWRLPTAGPKHVADRGRAAAIDLHNTAQRWNKALLDNSARPSGALVYTARDGNLTTEHYDRLKRELESGS